MMTTKWLCMWKQQLKFVTGGSVRVVFALMIVAVLNTTCKRKLKDIESSTAAEQRRDIRT